MEMEEILKVFMKKGHEAKMPLSAPMMCWCFEDVDGYISINGILLQNFGTIILDDSNKRFRMVTNDTKFGKEIFVDIGIPFEDINELKINITMQGD